LDDVGEFLEFLGSAGDGLAVGALALEPLSDEDGGERRFMPPAA